MCNGVHSSSKCTRAGGVAGAGGGGWTLALLVGWRMTRPEEDEAGIGMPAPEEDEAGIGTSAPEEYGEGGLEGGVAGMGSYSGEGGLEGGVAGMGTYSGRAAAETSGLEGEGGIGTSAETTAAGCCSSQGRSYCRTSRSVRTIGIIGNSQPWSSTSKASCILQLMLATQPAHPPIM